MHTIPILHVITRLIVGGAQENTLATVIGLRQAGGWDVGLLTGPDAGAEGSLLEEAGSLGAPVEVLPTLRREIRPLDDLRAGRALERRFSRRRPLIVHTHSSKAGLLGRRAAHRAGVPVIIHTVHGWSFHPHLSPWRRHLYVLLERQAARWSDALVVVAGADRDTGLAHRIGRPEQYALVRSGIDLERFGSAAGGRRQIRERLGIPADVPVVGSVTRLSPQKAPLDLVAAFDRIGRELPNVWFVIAGDGPLRDDVESRLRASAVAGRCVLTGLRRDIAELLAAFDLFLLSSLWEGLPRVLPQAMAAGVAVVATRTPGAAEVIVTGRSGELVEPGEPTALADRAVALLARPEQRRRYVEAGRLIAREFDERTMVSQLEEIYRRSLAAKGIQRPPA